MNWLKSFLSGFTTAPSPEPQTAKPRMPDNFSPDAQHALAFGRKEAARLGNNFVGTEHLLLGILKLGQGPAVQVLLRLGLDLEAVKAEIEKHVGTDDEKVIGNIPATYSVFCLARSLRLRDPSRIPGVQECY